MRTVKLIINILLLLLVVFILLMAYSGFFKKVKIEEKEIGPFSMIYLHHSGSYSYTYELQDSVSKVLERQDIPIEQNLLIYYDNPEETNKQDLESDAGCVVPKDKYEMKHFPSGFQYRNFQATKAMVVSFPHKNRLSLYAGIIKAYSKFKEYREEHDYAETYSIEFYNEKQDEIIFMMPVKEK